MEKNESLQLAEQYVNETRQNIFLTGKAGTGKTTFVNKLRETTFKRHVVVAPTGVAAINAGGMTIHSFFQLPFGTLNTPEKQQELRVRKYNGRKRAIIRTLDLLIIDEVSMVRADLMDAIDYVLRHIRRVDRPFGGVQLLLIGDLFQLPPVVRNDEISLLSQDYNSHYFFGSNALQNSNLVTIELTHIYRQQAGTFVDILNEVRNNQLSKKSLDVLNEQFHKEFENEVKPIILTSHRRTSDEINQKRLIALTTESQIFDADIEGEFPESMYPNDSELELKVGARVMFIKNDRDEVKRYYNGKLGTLIECDEDDEYVTVLTDDGQRIEVFKEQWANESVAIEPQSKELVRQVVGSFEQLPLRLAWAITIHKSQGLTFDHVEIDAQAAFAHGQVYVALSRCRTLEGIKLRSKIAESAIRNDHAVVSYEQQYHENQPTESSFKEARKDFERFLLLELFDYRIIGNALEEMQNLLQKIYNDDILPGREQLNNLAIVCNEKILPVARKFSQYIEFALATVDSILESEPLIERLQKAANYFYPILNKELWTGFIALSLEIDNKGLSDRIDQHLESIRWSIYSKFKVMQVLESPYVLAKVLEAQAKAPLHFDDAIKKAITYNQSKSKQGSVSIKKESLYEMLNAWRTVTANNNGLATSKVLTVKSIMKLCAEPPNDIKSLKLIKGIGPKTIEQYGEAILDIISGYQQQKSVSVVTRVTRSDRKKDDINNTTYETLSLWQQGKSKEEICVIRELSLGTIEKHLSDCITYGKIDIKELMSEQDRDTIASYFREFKPESLSAAKEHFGNTYSYGELRLVQRWMDLKRIASL